MPSDHHTVTLLIAAASEARLAHMSQQITTHYPEVGTLRTASTIAEALALAATGNIAAILSDSTLMDGDAATLCQMLRANQTGHTIPILVIGQDLGSRARIALLTAGADDVVMQASDERLIVSRLRLLLSVKDIQRPF